MNELKKLMINKIIEIKNKENNFHSEKWNFIYEYLKKDEQELKNFLEIKSNSNFLNFYNKVIETYYSWR